MFCRGEKGIQLVIDFTVPKSGYLHGITAIKNNNHYICGTTGLSDDQISHIDQLAKEKGLSVMICPNFAKGINALLKAIPLFDEIYDYAFISEHHHISKIDKPSGTALKLSKKFKSKAIDIISYRSTSPVVSHTVTFYSEYETVTITHQVNNKLAFCDGVYDTLLKVGTWSGVKYEL
jgi:4-hydroxy-tetrahydrodipicolinate reductase